jgi:iron(III) transport system ATP-binding protein
MLVVEQLSVRFGAVTALHDVSFTVARGEIVCLLGPSGSGKSTLLRLIAGIDRPASGRILIDGTEVAGPEAFVEPEARRVGMVFQDYALFPHLTVAANVAFGARGRERAGAELLARLGLERLAGSYPHMLSGGERQRVALARAMTPQPRILLMDEPFSSLDSRLREDVRRQTLAFLRETGTTTVIVTHDPDEALRIADRIALLDAGRLVQIGSPQELYAAPRTLFAARFFSEIAALPGTCRDGRVDTALGSFAAARVTPGARAFACLRPEHLTLASAPTPIVGRVVGSQFCGDARELLVAVDGVDAPLTLRVSREQAAEVPDELHEGALVHVGVRDHDVPVVAA